MWLRNINHICVCDRFSPERFNRLPVWSWNSIHRYWNDLHYCRRGAWMCVRVVRGEEELQWGAGRLPPGASGFSPFIISNEAKPSGTNISLGYDRLCPYTVLHPRMRHLPPSVASWEICTDSICAEMVSTSVVFHLKPNHTVTTGLSSGFYYDLYLIR